MTELVELYFDQLNVYFPLLHRPTFENGIRNGLHIADQGFGSVLLCVCALGARFSTHTRVILPRHKLMALRWVAVVQAGSRKSSGHQFESAHSLRFTSGLGK